MSFLTPEQVRDVRIKGSEILKLEELNDKEIRVIKMSSSRQLEAGLLQEARALGKASQADVLLYMLQHSCADMAGNPLTADDARTLFDVLSLSTVTMLVNKATALIKKSTEGIPSSAPGEATIDAVPLTDAEKKGTAS